MFLQLEKLVVRASVSANPSFVKMNLEFDETSQCMRLRRGLIEVDGHMPVLVFRLTWAMCEDIFCEL